MSKIKKVTWKTWDGKIIHGFKCQVDANTIITSPTMDGLKKAIQNHLPLNQDGAEAWYGLGRYMGD